MLNRHEKALLSMMRVWFNGADVSADELESYLNGWVSGGMYCGESVSIPSIVCAYHDAAFFDSLAD